MVVSLDTLLGGSTRNMGAVHPTIKIYALELVRRAYANGIKVIITSGLRTMEEQARLYGQGRSSFIYRGKQYASPGKNKVTNAAPGQSVHNYGFAVDYALMLDNGAVVWDMKRDDNKRSGSDWREVAALAKEMGFSWGGDWQSFPDFPHIDYGGLTWRQLQAGKLPTIPPLKNATPTVNADVLMNGDAGPKVKELQEQMNLIGIKVKVDGVFGDELETAVKLFQQRTGLKKDGVYGSGSKAKMKVLVDRENETAKTAAKKPKPTELEEILMSLLKLSTNEGKNALLIVLKRFEKKDPPLAAIWREKVEKNEFTHDDAFEILFVAIMRGYITGLVNVDDIEERLSLIEENLSEEEL